MWLELFIWTLVAIVAIVASAIEATARAVRDLQPATMSTRAHQLEFWGGLISIVAVALDGAMIVVLFSPFQANMEWLTLGVAASTMIVMGVSNLARKWAHDHLEQLVLPLFGEAMPFLPLVEPRDDSPQAEATRDATVEQMVDASERVGLIESDEREMISGILQLDQTLVREIMVPRIDVIAVEAETSLYDALDVMIDGAHSRVPVYEETMDHIIGLLYAKDILRLLRDGKTNLTLRELVRPAYLVPESKRLDELLQELQKNKVHMAIVVDEYGGTAGLVTIEDILEEIVGEIQDEYDTGEPPLVERLSENEGVFDARVNLSEVNEMLGLTLPTETNTLGGLVYQSLQKMPKVGDQVQVGDVWLTVLEVLGRRIKKVRVLKAVPSQV